MPKGYVRLSQVVYKGKQVFFKVLSDWVTENTRHNDLVCIELKEDSNGSKQLDVAEIYMALFDDREVVLRETTGPMIRYEDMNIFIGHATPCNFTEGQALNPMCLGQLDGMSCNPITSTT